MSDKCNNDCDCCTLECKGRDIVEHIKKVKNDVEIQEAFLRLKFPTFGFKEVINRALKEVRIPDLSRIETVSVCRGDIAKFPRPCFGETFALVKDSPTQSFENWVTAPGMYLIAMHKSSIKDIFNFSNFIYPDLSKKLVLNYKEQILEPLLSIEQMKFYRNFTIWHFIRKEITYEHIAGYLLGDKEAGFFAEGILSSVIHLHP